MRERERSFDKDPYHFCFLSKTNQIQIAVFNGGFLPRVEGWRQLNLCLHLTNSLNYHFNTFSLKSLSPLLNFPGVFPFILLVGIFGHFYCTICFFQPAQLHGYTGHTRVVGSSKAVLSPLLEGTIQIMDRIRNISTTSEHQD